MLTYNVYSTVLIMLYEYNGYKDIPSFAEKKCLFDFSK